MIDRHFHFLPYLRGITKCRTVTQAKSTTEVSGKLPPESGNWRTRPTQRSNDSNLPPSTTVTKSAPSVTSGSRKFYCIKTIKNQFTLAKNEIFILQKSGFKVCVSVEYTNFHALLIGLRVTSF